MRCLVSVYSLAGDVIANYRSSLCPKKGIVFSQILSFASFIIFIFFKKLEMILLDFFPPAWFISAKCTSKIALSVFVALGHNFNRFILFLCFLCILTCPRRLTKYREEKCKRKQPELREWKKADNHSLVKWEGNKKFNNLTDQMSVERDKRVCQPFKIGQTRKPTS